MTATVKALIERYRVADADQYEYQHRVEEAAATKRTIVRQLRDQGLTRVEVAELLGLTPQRISQIGGRQ